MLTKEKLEKLREDFPNGCRVVLEYMGDDPTPIPVGTEGVVSHVDDIGTIHINWTCGSGLGLLYGVDRCHRIDTGGTNYDDD